MDQRLDKINLISRDVNINTISGEKEIKEKKSDCVEGGMGISNVVMVGVSSGHHWSRTSSFTISVAFTPNILCILCCPFLCFCQIKNHYNTLITTFQSLPQILRMCSHFLNHSKLHAKDAYCLM